MTREQISQLMELYVKAMVTLQEEDMNLLEKVLETALEAERMRLQQLDTVAKRDNMLHDFYGQADIKRANELCDQ